MEEKKELTGIERELVLQYLRDDNVPVTVTLEDKPVARETDLEEESDSPSAEERLPASAIFPVALPSEQLTVLDQGIILLKNNAQTRLVKDFLGKTVRVQFYFNKVGLYFITEMKDYSKGLALVVPKSIYRMEDNVREIDWDFNAFLSYKDVNGKNVSIECEPLPDYKLFVQPLWNEIELDVQKEAKTALESYVLESREEGGVSIGNGLHLLRVCRYLTQKELYESAAVEGRAHPLRVLYVDDKRLVLGKIKDSVELSLEESFCVTLSVSLPAHKSLKRVIKSSCIVENIYSLDDSEKKCFVLRFNDMKLEDVRYLSEKMQMRH